MDLVFEGNDRRLRDLSLETAVDAAHGKSALNERRLVPEHKAFDGGGVPVPVEFVGNRHRRGRDAERPREGSEVLVSVGGGKIERKGVVAVSNVLCAVFLSELLDRFSEIRDRMAERRTVDDLVAGLVAEVLAGIEPRAEIAYDLLSVFCENETADIVVVVRLVVVSRLGGETVRGILDDPPFRVLCAVDGFFLHLLNAERGIEPRDIAGRERIAGASLREAGQFSGQQFDLVPVFAAEKMRDPERHVGEPRSVRKTDRHVTVDDDLLLIRRDLADLRVFEIVVFAAGDVTLHFGVAEEIAESVLPVVDPLETESVLAVPRKEAIHRIAEAGKKLHKEIGTETPDRRRRRADADRRPVVLRGQPPILFARKIGVDDAALGLPLHQRTDQGRKPPAEQDRDLAERRRRLAGKKIEADGIVVQTVHGVRRKAPAVFT